MFKSKDLEKVRKRILCLKTFSRKSRSLRDNVGGKKYGVARLATYINIILRIKDAISMPDN
jgi:hypothetical protein